MNINDMALCEIFEECVVRIERTNGIEMVLKETLVAVLNGIECELQRRKIDHVKKCSDFDLLDLYTAIESECQKRDLMG